MWTSLDLLSAVRDYLKKSNKNDTLYRVAKELGVAEGTARNWSRGGIMDDENAIKIAVLLKLDVEYVLACMHAERAKGKESYPVLCSIAERVKPKKAA